MGIIPVFYTGIIPSGPWSRQGYGKRGRRFPADHGCFTDTTIRKGFRRIMENNVQLSTLTLTERIQLLLSSMSRKQAKVAAYILENVEVIPFYTLAELSEYSGVSEASIVRLTATLGYEGFSDMQHQLRSALKNRISMSKRMDLMGRLGADSASIMHMVVQKGVEGLRRTMLRIKPKDFEKAVDLLANAERVFMFGSRSSFYLIEFFALELRWIRNEVYALSTESSAFDALSDLREGDVLFAISMPRYLRTTIQTVQLAWEKHIPTIAVTDSLASPLIPYTSIPLLVDNEIFSYCDNIVPIAAILTALLNAVGTKTSPRSNEILAKNEATWNHFHLYHQHP